MQRDGVIRRRLLIIAVVVTALLGGLQLGWPAESMADQDALVASGVTATLPPAATQPSLPSLNGIVGQARRIAAERGTVWSKAAAVRNLVRATLPDSDDCGTMANAFWSVGTMVGLPLRVVYLSANGQNLWDTHTVVEVWLAGPRRWAISDPTFNGYWTLGRGGVPIGVEEIQHALDDGSASDLYWHGAGTAHSTLPSHYYVDPTYLFKYAELRAVAAGFGSGFLVSNEGNAFFAGDTFVPTANVDFGPLPPGATIPVNVYQKTAFGSPNGVLNFSGTPSYADQLVSMGTLSVPARGQVGIPTIGNLSRAIVLAVGRESGDWFVDTGIHYLMDPYQDERVSPIIFLGTPTELGTDAASEQSVTLRIWTVRLFPHTRELTARWGGGVITHARRGSPPR